MDRREFSAGLLAAQAAPIQAAQETVARAAKGMPALRDWCSSRS